MKKLIFLSILLIGCGTRKVSNSIVKEDKKETTTEVVTDNSTSKTEIIIDTNTNEVIENEIFEPINNEKPFIVDGKTYINTKVTKSKTKRLKSDKIKSNEVIANNKKRKKKSVVVTQSKVKQKETEKTFNYWWLLLIIPIIYFGNKYKKSIFAKLWK